MNGDDFLVAVTFLTGTFIGGYGSWNSDATVNASEEYTLEDLGAASPLYANEVRDKDTGVHYFYNRSFMCPRYNADGSLYTD